MSTGQRITPAVAQARARLAGLRRQRPADDPVVVAAAEALERANGESEWTKVADELTAMWPTLTDEQRRSFTELLSPVVDGAYGGVS